MKALQEIEKEVAALARRVGASLHDMPTCGVSRDSGYPHIEVKDGLYHYVVVERGEERERRSSADFDDLVYWIFRDVTHSMAFFPEDMARIRDQDCRRVAFPKQIQLMQRLGPKMGERMEQHIAEILRQAPYDDEPTRALNRMRGGWKRPASPSITSNIQTPLSCPAKAGIQYSRDVSFAHCCLWNTGSPGQAGR